MYYCRLAVARKHSVFFMISVVDPVPLLRDTAFCVGGDLVLL